MRSRTAATVNPKAFTLVELLATIAILAALVAVSLPFIANYVSTARARADEQTLLILNDAINRYKMGGGSLTALTAGKPLPNLLSALQAPVSWNGVTHQFLRSGENIPSATTIEATGSGAAYRLTAFNSFNQGGGSAAPLSAAPSFDGEIQRYIVAPSTHDTYHLTLASNVAQGKRLVLTYVDNTSISDVIDSISDSRGNTWTMDSEYHSGINRYLAIASTIVTTALQTGDTITIHYTNNAYQADAGALFVLENTPNKGTAAVGATYDSFVSVTSAVPSSPAVLIGLVFAQSGATYTTDWTLSGSILTSDSNDYYLVYKTTSSSGNQTLGGTLSATTSYIATWVPYY